MFETKGTINEENIKKFKKYLMTPLQKNVFIILISIFTLIGLINISLGDKYIVAIAFIGAIILVAEYLLIINKYCKVFMDRVEEIAGKREITYEISFDELTATINNANTGGKVVMKYDSFVRFIEIPEAYLIITKTNQVFIIDKKYLNDREGEFDLFMREKCKNLK